MRKFVPRKKSFVPTSFRRRATLTNWNRKPRPSEAFLHPEGPERHLNAARQKFGCEAGLAAQVLCNYLHRGVSSNKKKRENLSCGGEAVCEPSSETIWVRALASQRKCCETVGVNFCPKACDPGRHLQECSGARA